MSPHTSNSVPFVASKFRVFRVTTLVPCARAVATIDQCARHFTSLTGIIPGCGYTLRSGNEGYGRSQTGTAYNGCSRSQASPKGPDHRCHRAGIHGRSCQIQVELVSRPHEGIAHGCLTEA